jgi:hypothetical protein
MNTSDPTVAAAWLAGLAARGVTVTLVKNRIRMQPETAYKALTADELLVLRDHRPAIRDALRGGASLGSAATLMNIRGGDPPNVPTPKACPYCYRSPCIGEAHASFAVLHPDEPAKPRYNLADLNHSGRILRDAVTHGLSSTDDPTSVMLKMFGIRYS